MRRMVFSLAGLIAVGSCGLFPCGADDLDIRFVPSDVTVVVGQTQTARVELGSCHFGRTLSDRITWTSDDPAIASVDFRPDHRACRRDHECPGSRRNVP
jgi:hypothetical protein